MKHFEACHKLNFSLTLVNAYFYLGIIECSMWAMYIMQYNKHEFNLINLFLIVIIYCVEC